MTKVTPRAIVIGTPEVSDALASLKPEWDFLPAVESVSEFFVGLRDLTIDSNIQIVITLDHYFDPTAASTDFEKLVVTMSPYCFFVILNYNNQSAAIKERVEYEAYVNGSNDPLYFFVDPERPGLSLDTSLTDFFAKSTAEDVVAILSGREISDEAIADFKVGEAESSLGELPTESDYLGQIVAVTSSKGGSGKTTVAATLASYLVKSSEASAQAGFEDRPLKVIIVDLDVRDGQLGFITSHGKPSVLQLRLEGISNETLDNTIITGTRLGPDLLLAPKRPRTSDDTPPDFYIELLHALRQRYDYIILDTSVNYLDPLLEKVAYPAAEQIIFVTDIIINSVFSMTRWIQEVTRPKSSDGMGINPKKIGIVANKALADVGMSSKKIEHAAMKLPIISVIPSNPKLVAHALNMQSAELLLTHPDIKSSVRRIARAVVGSKYKLNDEF